MDRIEQMYDRVLKKMDMGHEMTDEELLDLIHIALNEAGEEKYMPLQEKIHMSRELFNAFRKLDILQDLVEDEEITEIMINGTDSIFLEKKRTAVSIR